jgi:conjugal transfer pilus assembly protein TraD
MLHEAAHALGILAAICTIAAGGGVALATLLRRRRLAWTWAATGIAVAYVLIGFYPKLGAAIGGAVLLALFIGARWHRSDIEYGADLAQAAENRLGIRTAIRRSALRRRAKKGRWVNDGWLMVGEDQRGLPVSIPIGYRSGSHTLVLGATGSGKTVSETWITCRLIEQGHGAIVIDPKGDELLHQQLQLTARKAGCRFFEWTPEGPCAYNPYAHGGATEIADKALAGEQFTEPHYLRQAQRYLGHAIRTLHATNTAVTPVSLMAHLDPGQLEVTTRALPDTDAVPVQAYLDGLTDRQRRDLGGVRDRLSILAESDTSRWLNPTGQAQVIDLRAAVDEQAVVYFRLDSDRRVLLSQMIAAAIVSDLITLVADLQSQPIPTVVAIDEFAAVAAEHVARLFGRARSAGISLILGTQELADLKSVGEGLRDQVLGNVSALIAHRQNVPESAELISGIAGTKPVWITTEQTEDQLLGTSRSGRGSRRRGYEYHLHPSHIKQLATGTAAVLALGSGQPAVVASILHPTEAGAVSR